MKKKVIDRDPKIARIFPKMGGGGSTEHHHHHHTQTVYRVPPETQKALDDQTEKLKGFEEEAQRRADPVYFKENSANLMDTFVEALPELKLTEFIKKETGDTHIGFIGQVSSGKTTMINTLFDKELPVAMGNCTEKCEVVHSEDHMVVWDVAGQNDDYKFYDPMSLSFVKDLDKVVILFDNDISMISNILKVVHKINPDNMIIVRTKVDQHNNYNVRSVQEEQDLDKEKVKNLLGVEMKVFSVSSNNILFGTGEKFDWDLLKKELGL